MSANVVEGESAALNGFAEGAFLEKAEFRDAASGSRPVGTMDEDEGEKFTVEVSAEALGAAADGLGAYAEHDGEVADREAVLKKVCDEYAILFSEVNRS